MTTMLIVEDELKTGTYLKQGLLEAGYDVTLVNDGRQGLEHILRQHYDCLLYTSPSPRDRTRSRMPSSA